MRASLPRWTSLLALFLAGCGGDDAAPAGVGGSGATGGGAGAGGAAGAGGSAGGGSGGLPADVTPPQFAGVESASPDGDDAVALGWSAATDDQSPASRIAYRVYVAPVGETLDYARAHLTTPAGALGTRVEGLRARTGYQFAVRAVDSARNAEANTVTLTATTPDTQPPTFGGVSGAASRGAGEVLVQWAGARDNGDAAGELRYLIYVATSPTAFDYTTPTHTTGPGATSATVTGLSSGVPLWVVVRAQDSSGNVDTNTRAVAVTTPEGTPPVFAGVERADVVGTDVTLSWSPASDNVTPPTAIVYDIFMTETNGAFDFLRPTVTTAPGALRHTFTGLKGAWAYYFVVRATDALGNTDANTVQVDVVTGAVDLVAPSFGGVSEVISESPTTVKLSWAPATDDRTPATGMVYSVYVSTSVGAGATPVLVTRPGVTSVIVSGLTPATPYYARVVSSDEAGNVDINAVERSVTTLTNAAGDTTPPVPSSTFTVTRIDAVPTALLAEWAAATDDTAGAADLRYHLCAGATAADCEGAAFFVNRRVTADWGSASTFVTDLLPRTASVVTLMVEDRSGNFASTVVTATGTTSTSYVTNVAPLLAGRCGGSCHTFNYGTLVNVASTYTDATAGVLPLVTPGDLVGSYLFRKLRPTADTAAPFSTTVPNAYAGARMPSDGLGPLSTDEEAVFSDWITQGAFNQ